MFSCSEYMANIFQYEPRQRKWNHQYYLFIHYSCWLRDILCSIIEILNFCLSFGHESAIEFSSNVAILRTFAILQTWWTTQFLDLQILLFLSEILPPRKILASQFCSSTGRTMTILWTDLLMKTSGSLKLSESFLRFL